MESSARANVVCKVTPKDGTDFGAAVSSAAVVISNTAPTATSVNITPNPAKDGDKLVCNYTFNDADGDSESGTAIEWVVTNTGGSTSTYSGATLSSGFNRGDSVVCSVTPKDGALSGIRVSSARLVISNSAPAARSVNNTQPGQVR